MMEQSSAPEIDKRRRIGHPTLDGVIPFKPSTTTGIKGMGERRVCPCFSTMYPAWRKEAEPQVLLERPCIRKSPFALFAARHYFLNGDLVLLYYENKFWAFTKTDPADLANLPGVDLDPNLLQKHTIEETSETFWYANGTDQSKAMELAVLLQSGGTVTIRDPGASENKLGLVKSDGREVYTVSSNGQEDFFWQVKKTGIPPAMNQRCAELWNGDEFVYGAKLGLLDHVCFPAVGPYYLALDYIMEGYRRYGGLARMVFEFARKRNSEKTPTEGIITADIPAEMTSCVATIANLRAV
eukprot:scaffold115092_cov55-Attheya_sp.AAC.2